VAEGVEVVGWAMIDKAVFAADYVVVYADLPSLLMKKMKTKMMWMCLSVAVVVDAVVAYCTFDLNCYY
jgi:hypothetical protein